MPSTTPISLLWPPDYTRPAALSRVSQSAIADLDLDSTVQALAPSRRYSEAIRAILLHLCDDPAVIIYRQDVIADLLDHPDLVARLEQLLPDIEALDHYGYSGRPGQTPLHEVVWRIGQLESYVTCMQGLRAAFDGLDRPLRAAGLCRLDDHLNAITRDEGFQKLVADLPNLLEQVRSIASITIGVNLDDQLRPVEATLLAINKKKFRGLSSSLLGALLNKHGDTEGIAPLHAVPRYPSAFGGEYDNPMMYPLFRDLSQVLKQASRPVAAALHHYARINTQLLGALKAELAFYLGAVGLINRLAAAHLPVCRPDIVPKDERICEVEATYNLNLAVRFLSKGADGGGQAVVCNDIHFGPDGRIFILTGPNQGGKTTYTQAAGLLQVLAQAGLYVPGRRARISPVDGIYTHFPVEEAPDMEAGRLGEESRRLNDIFAHATRYSLILLNESLSSTSFGESLYLARDIVAILRRLGARAIYATHLHELAAGVETLNAEVPGDSTIVSLVSLVNSDGATFRQTFKIVPSPPLGRSYAREIAARYGISYEQLIELLRTRGLLDGT